MYPGKWAAVAPDRPAVVLAGTGETLTYAQLDRDSIRLARLLAQRGLRRGDVVALVSDNSPSAFVVYWATRRSGLYLTAVNWHLAPDEAAYILADCDAKAVVVSAGVGELATVATADLPDDVVRLAYGGDVPGFERLTDALAGVSDEPLHTQPKGTDMLYSSGTTGRPKGVKSPLPEVSVDDPVDVIAMVFGGAYGFGEDTRYLSPAPVYHAAPLRFAGAVMALGGTVVMLERFEAAAALEAIGEHQITHTQMVPTMFVRLLKLPGAVRAAADVSSLRVVIHAAAPCPVEVKQAMIDWLGPIVFEYYASTEGAGITMIDSASWLERPGSVGRSMLGPVHICSDDGAELPAGATGTVFFQYDAGPLFSYHGDAAKTQAGRHPEHDTWVSMGDVGHLDEDGFLFLTDRKAFMIISGGVNIYPQETEDVLALHPKVFDVAVIGVPDTEMGEAVKAVVVPAPGVEPGPALEAEILAFVRERLSRFKCPRSVDFVTELPRTPTGKLVKGKLRAQYV
jgi:long-chain acyl-CoA synthetase